MSQTPSSTPQSSNYFIQLIESQLDATSNVYDYSTQSSIYYNAYVYICSQVQVADLRTYYNATKSTGLAKLQNLWEAVNACPMEQGDPPSCTTDEFNDLKQFLLCEIYSAYIVSDFFNEMPEIYEFTFLNNKATIDEVINALSLTSTKDKVSGLLYDMAMGMVGTFGAVMPEVGLLTAVIAGAVNVYTDLSTVGGTMPPDAFNTTVDELYKSLDDSYLPIITNVEAMRIVFINDPYKCSALSWGMGTGQNGLNAAPVDYWTTLTKAQVKNSMMQAYKIEILKLLLPLEFSVYYGINLIQSDTSGGPRPVSLGKIDSYDDTTGIVDDFYWDNTPFLQYVPALMVPYNDKFSKYYWIAKTEDSFSMLDAASIYPLLNGSTDVFMGNNGWKLVPTIFGWDNSPLSTINNIIAYRIANMSSYNFTVSTSCQKGYVLFSKQGSDNIVASGANTSNTLTTGTNLDYEGCQKDGLSRVPITFTITATDGSLIKPISFTASCPHAIAATGQSIDITPSNITGVYNNKIMIECYSNSPSNSGDHGGGLLIVISDAVQGDGPIHY